MQNLNALFTLPVLDDSTVITLQDLGPEVIDEIAHVFAADVPGRLVRLRDASAIGGDAVRLEAHALKGSALAVGATRMAGICAALEHGEIGAANPVVQDRVASAFSDARDALFEVCRRRAQS